MRSPEGHEKHAIDSYLKKIGVYVVKPASGGFGVSGTSDRLVCCRGRFASIEVKRQGKEPTPLQWQRIREVEANGGKAFWGAAGKVIPEFEAWLASIKT